MKRSDKPNPAIHKLVDLEYWKSADIASEACADLLSLKLLARIEPNWQNLSNALIAVRLADENAAVAGVSPLSPSYQIGQALTILVPMLVGNPRMSEQAIHVETWEMAFNVAMGKGNLFGDTVVAIANLVNPLRQVPLIKPKPKGFGK